MSIIGKATGHDLDQYAHVLLTSPHEWDTSVLGYSHPNSHGYPPGHQILLLGTNMIQE